MINKPDALKSKKTLKLDQLRKSIDDIDDQILQLLNQRMTFVKNIGDLKRVKKEIIYRPEREKAILERLFQEEGLLTRQAIEAIYLEIFAVSRNLELPEKVAYLGPLGSFTHQAAESRFGAMSEYLSFGSIKSVFQAVDTGKTRFGVVPIENNQEGMVSETLDLLERLDLKIAAEVPMSIHFSFASVSEEVKSIKKIYSKDIAFRQCKTFIEDMYGEEIALVAVESTSKAAKLAASEPGTAAICSHIAAKSFDLPILFENIEDSENNQTRFILISKDFLNQKGKVDKTTILAKLSNQPGALADFLQEFHKANINLTKIESRPAKKHKSFKYWFLIDFEGHFEDEAAQYILEKYKSSIKLLGSYPKLC